MDIIEIIEIIVITFIISITGIAVIRRVPARALATARTRIATIRAARAVRKWQAWAARAAASHRGVLVSTPRSRANYRLLTSFTPQGWEERFEREARAQIGPTPRPSGTVRVWGVEVKYTSVSVVQTYDRARRQGDELQFLFGDASPLSNDYILSVCAAHTKDELKANVIEIK